MSVILPYASTVREIARALEAREVSKYSAQSFFLKVAQLMGLPISPRKLKQSLASAKHAVKALVDNGYVDFYYNEGSYSWYIIPTTVERARMSARAVGQGQVLENWRLPEGSLHMQAARLMAQRKYVPNAERVKTLKAKLSEGIIFSDGKWKKLDEAPTEEEKTKLEEQKAIAEALDTLGAASFDCGCDGRGRFYLGGGLVSPQNGRLLRWLFTHDDETTLDHRTSFAQLLALLYGLPELGKRCGIGTAEPCDLYLGILKAAGIDADHDSPERKVCKKVVMPMAYGQSSKNAAAVADELGKSLGIEPERLRKVLDASLKAAKAFEKLSFDARRFAQECADDGEMPQWTTPSGFRACKDYYTRRRVEWCTSDDSGETMPCSMTFLIPTKVIATKGSEELGYKSVLVATAANIIQSLDAALMARVVVEFHKQTGEIPFTIHDSYTVSKKNADALRRIVADQMGAMYTSKEMDEIRRELRIPRGRLGLIDFFQMNPLETEA